MNDLTIFTDESTGMLVYGSEKYTASAIYESEPYNPPLKYQHTMLAATALCTIHRNRTALQVGVGFGAQVHALERMGFQVTGIDIDTSLWKPYESKSTVIEQDYFDYTTYQYDFVCIDMCGPMPSSDKYYNENMFASARALMKPSGVLVFNLGPWPNFTRKALVHLMDHFYTMVLPSEGTCIAVGTSRVRDFTTLHTLPSWLQHDIWI